MKYLTLNSCVVFSFFPRGSLEATPANPCRFPWPTKQYVYTPNWYDHWQRAHWRLRHLHILYLMFWASFDCEPPRSFASGQGYVLLPITDKKSWFKPGHALAHGLPVVRLFCSLTPTPTFTPSSIRLVRIVINSRNHSPPSVPKPTVEVEKRKKKRQPETKGIRGLCLKRVMTS